MEERRIRAKDSVFRNYHLFAMACAIILALILLFSGIVSLAALAGAFALVELYLLYATVYGRFAKEEEDEEEEEESSVEL